MHLAEWKPRRLMYLPRGYLFFVFAGASSTYQKCVFDNCVIYRKRGGKKTDAWGDAYECDDKRRIKKIKRKSRRRSIRAKTTVRKLYSHTHVREKIRWMSALILQCKTLQRWKKYRRRKRDRSRDRVPEGETDVGRSNRLSRAMLFPKKGRGSREYWWLREFDGILLASRVRSAAARSLCDVFASAFRWERGMHS